MGSDDHLEADDGIAIDARPACVALVPYVEPTQWSHRLPPPAPNSIFVTQLIANETPVNDNLRRTVAADASAAYTANRHRIVGAGIRSRQVA